MKNRTRWIAVSVILGVLGLLAATTVLAGPVPDVLAPRAGVNALAAPLGTPFTYQGKLEDGSGAVTANCEMAFRLYDEGGSGGSQMGSAITATVPITEGLFTVGLDFGSGVFTGDDRWLGIKVQCPGDSAFADLGRQKLTATPYALYALGAPWDGLTGVPADLADGDDDTTYTNGFGLSLTGTTFGVMTDTIQQRVMGVCGTGYAIRQINDDGSVVCEEDNGLAYTAGEGLVLTGTQFSAQGSPYASVVVVAKSGGDYTSVQAAIDSIAGATEDNPYLVWVAPGVYSETVMMKPYVHLQGSGQETTVITSNVGTNDEPFTQGTLILTRHVTLRDLTVGNSGADTYNIALLAMSGTTQTLVVDVTALGYGSGVSSHAISLWGSDTGVRLQSVTAIARPQGSGSGYGIINKYNAVLIAENVTALAENESSGDSFGLNNQATAKLFGGSFTGKGGRMAWAIHNDTDAILEGISVVALGENCSDICIGFINGARAEATLHGGYFIGRGGSQAEGINNQADATLETQGVTALGEDGSDYNYGLWNSVSVATLRASSFTGHGGIAATGILNLGSNAVLDAEGVTALGDGSSDLNRGLHNTQYATATLRGGSFTGRGGDGGWGIHADNQGTLLAVEIVALGEDGSNESSGLANGPGTVTTLRGGSFTGRGGGIASGVANGGDSNAVLTVERATLLGENGTSNYGLWNKWSATASVTQSVLEGATNSVFHESGTVTVTNSRLVGNSVSGTVTCVAVSRGITFTVGTTCP